MLPFRLRPHRSPALPPPNPAGFSPEVEANVRFLGDRAREIVEQEVDRARGIDTKGAGLIAVSFAGIAGAIGLVSKITSLSAGSGAHKLWAVEVIAGLLAFLPAVGFAVWAIAPTAFRIAVHVDALKTWTTPNVLEKDPVENEGELLAASVVAVDDARRIIDAKAKRLRRAFIAFVIGVLAVMACGVSIGVHSAVYPLERAVGSGSSAQKPSQARSAAGAATPGPGAGKRTRRSHVSATKTGHEPSRGLPGSRPSRGRR